MLDSISRCATRCATRTCDNFLYGFKGAPPARQRWASARHTAEGRELAGPGIVD
jgi:hypothetical protein